MPSRIVREGILTSERVDRIADDPATEVFYRRLHSVVDDYGRFSAHPSLLRAALYPLRLDKITDEDVSGHLAACAAAGLIRLYRVDGKPYLEVVDFRQKMRAKRSKYPPPDPHVTDKCGADEGHMIAERGADDPHVTDKCGARAGHVRTESETRIGDENRESEAHSPRATGFDDFIALYPKRVKLDAAARAYVSLIESPEEHDRLMAGLRRWLESRQWVRSLENDGGRFVPDPDRFIFERRYLDEPTPHTEGESGGDGDVVEQALRLMRRPDREAA